MPDLPRPKTATGPLQTFVAASGIDVSAGTCVPEWAGERMDLDMVVTGLLQADRRIAPAYYAAPRAGGHAGPGCGQARTQ